MLRIQKYGGSSVANVERLRAVAARVAARRLAGDDLVVVVSAMGDTTDDLIALARAVADRPSEREMDMLLSTGEVAASALLAMALEARGVPAISFTGAQAGFVTTGVHTKARIVRVNTDRIRRALGEGRVVVVAGFQGESLTEDVTTLGRGGSDTTAVALAASLPADSCEIFTDVAGVFTADPRICPGARKIPRIDYDEMLELASAGARVMQSRSIEFGKKHGVRIHVRSSFTEEEGTVIEDLRGESMEDPIIRGVAHDLDEAKVTVEDLPDRPGVAAAIFGALADRHINVDMIVQSAAEAGTNDISFTVDKADLPRALEIVRAAARDLGAGEVRADSSVAKVSIVGIGMVSHAGVAATMFRALAQERINIQMISTSEIKVSVVIDEARAADAVRALHRAFGLDRAGAPAEAKR